MTVIIRDTINDTESDTFADEWDAARFAQEEADRTGEEQHMFESGKHGNYITSFLPHTRSQRTGPIHLMTERFHPGLGAMSGSTHPEP